MNNDKKKAAPKKKRGGKLFTKDDKRASEGGKKSKRLPLATQWKDKLMTALGTGDKTTLDALYGILLNECKKGNIRAIQEVLDRSFGKSTQHTELTGLDGGAIESEIKFNVNFKK